MQPWPYRSSTSQAAAAAAAQPATLQPSPVLSAFMHVGDRLSVPMQWPGYTEKPSGASGQVALDALAWHKHAAATTAARPRMMSSEP